MKTNQSITYKDAGVDVEAGDNLVQDIRTLAARTTRPEVIGGIGSFNALFSIDTGKYQKPVIVSGTDGVGTKLKAAFAMNRHDTIGIDLVAMCVNDILTAGAEPLFFLDYLATGKLDTSIARDVIKGISEGCLQAGCSLVGGETAEMPGFYQENEYDLSGFAVGVVEKSRIISGETIRPGDTILGLPSSGLHSNGFSLVRKIFLERESLNLNTFIAPCSKSLGEELLTPTTIYVKPILATLMEVEVKGLAHITGGGISGNLPRIFPAGVGAIIDTSTWTPPPIFKLVQEAGPVSMAEMFKTFNMGIGFIIITDPESSERAAEIVTSHNIKARRIGNIIEGSGVTYK